MSEYKVTITISEVHVVYVEAENEEQAKDIACSKQSNGETEIVHEIVDFEVEEQDA